MARLRNRELAKSNVPPLSFDRTGGPVLAIVGLTGGAGASTLTYLLGSIAANHSSAPVLAMDTGGPMAALAQFAGTQSQLSLVHASNQVDAKQIPHGLIASSTHGARIMSAGRTPDNVEFDPAGVEHLIAFARDAHGLTIIDCGTLQREVERIALTCATHIIWLFPATDIGVGLATASLAMHDDLPDTRQILVARFDEKQPRALMSHLTQVAQSRNAPLVLMPYIPSLTSTDPRSLEDQLGTTIQALVTLTR